MSDVRNISLIAVRLLALIFVSVGVWMLAGNLIETITDFNPTFAVVYFKTQLLRPFVGIGVGLLIYWKSPSLARLLTRGLESEG